MSVFVITDADKERIASAAQRARSHPIPLEAVKRATETGVRPDNMPKPEIVDLPLGWRLNISCEIQPPGPLLHLSMSSPTPQQTLPRTQAMALVLDALGFDATLTPVFQTWIENYREAGKPAGQALNILIPSSPLPGGHA